MRNWAVAALLVGTVVAGCDASAPLICERDGQWYPAGWGVRSGTSPYPCVCSATTNSFVCHAIVLVPSEYADGCVATGCNGELCADEPIVTACTSSSERSCHLAYRTCVPGADGCEWAEDPGLEACLASLGDAGTAP